MKTLFVTLTLILSATQSFAADATVLASLTNVSNRISEITFDENGLLSVALRQTQEVATLRLSRENTRRFKWLAGALKDAPTVTEHHDLICMMLMLYTPTLSVASSGDDLAVVLSPESCALHDYTHPADENALQEALELKTSLIAVANELAAQSE